MFVGSPRNSLEARSGSTRYCMHRLSTKNNQKLQDVGLSAPKGGPRGGWRHVNKGEGTHARVCVYIYTCRGRYAHAHTHMFTYVCVCIYIYIYIYIQYVSGYLCIHVQPYLSSLARSPTRRTETQRGRHTERGRPRHRQIKEQREDRDRQI